jgi:signal peptidase II
VHDLRHDFGSDPAGSRVATSHVPHSSEGGAPAPYRRGERGRPGRPALWSPVLAEQPAPAPDGGPPSPEDGGAPPRRPRTLLLLGIAAAVFVLDLVSKLLVVAHLAPGEDVRLLGGAVYLTYLRNTGAAFSFAEGATVLFSLIAIGVAVVIVRQARRLFSTGWAIALGLVLGGAIGNLVDRLFRSPGFLRGGVVDFVSLFGPDGVHFAVFNLADSAITCGGVLGVLLALRGVEFDGTRGRQKASAGTPADDGGAARG